MSTAVLTNRLNLDSVADTTLKAAARFWFVVAIIGQLVFAFVVASFYGLTALRGDYHAWKFTNGYVPGVTKGNWAVVMHVTSAVVMLAGAVQLIPQIRNRFPAFHRWNGRIYMLTAVTLSVAGGALQHPCVSPDACAGERYSGSGGLCTVGTGLPSAPRKLQGHLQREACDADMNCVAVLAAIRTA